VELIKNKFFIIAVAVALILCILPTALTVMGHGNAVRDALSVAATPFRAVFNWIGDGFAGFGKYFSGMDALIKENNSLREELDQYKNGAANSEILKDENSWLREQLGFAGEQITCDLEDALIIGQSSSSYSSVFILNRGSEFGIKKNMAVIAPGGIVGYVKEVSRGSCKVACITDLSCSLGVYCSRSGVMGRAGGNEAYLRDGLLTVEGLDMDCNVQVGDLFCATGYGGLFPKGFPVGRVKAITEDEFMRTATAVLEPCVELDRLTRVFIVKSITLEVNNVD
jgi:rod shape-determining protein MreC